MLNPIARRAVAQQAMGSVFPCHENARMSGLIGKMLATPGQRDALVAILLEGLRNMPGCLSYIVAHDPADPDAL